MHSATILAILSFGLAPLASAHCKITAATGDAGGKSSGLAVTSSTGTNQGDTTIFNQTTGFGKTNKGGKIDATTAVPAAMKFAGSNTLAQVTPGGTLSMTLHQLNGDGAGPMACSISTDATGQQWTNIDVTTQVPGTKGRSKANNQDFKLAAAIPAGTTCTGSVGGQTGVCMVKCQNPVGPFGGTVAVQMAGGNTTDAAAAGTDTTTTGTTGATTGNTATGNAATGNTATGNTATGNTATGNTATGNTATAGSTNANANTNTATGKTSKTSNTGSTTGNAATGATTGNTAATGNTKQATKNAQKSKTAGAAANNRRDDLTCTDAACADFDDSESTAVKRDDASLACTDAACLDFDDSESTAEKRNAGRPVAVRQFLESKQ